MYGCMDVWMYGCMGVWVYGCMDVWMYGCMDVCMYVCMCVCVYVCMYICKYIHTQIIYIVIHGTYACFVSTSVSVSNHGLPPFHRQRPQNSVLLSFCLESGRHESERLGRFFVSLGSTPHKFVVNPTEPFAVPSDPYDPWSWRKMSIIDVNRFQYTDQTSTKRFMFGWYHIIIHYQNERRVLKIIKPCQTYVIYIYQESNLCPWASSCVRLWLRLPVVANRGRSMKLKSANSCSSGQLMISTFNWFNLSGALVHCCKWLNPIFGGAELATIDSSQTFKYQPSLGLMPWDLPQLSALWWHRIRWNLAIAAHRIITEW